MGFFCAEGMAHFCFVRQILTLFYLAVLVRISLEDMKTMRIGNREIGLLFGIGVLALLLEGGGAVPGKCMGLLAVSLPMLVLDLLVPGAFGGGDIKLMAAAGFCQGPREAAAGFVTAVFLAGIWSGFLVISGKKGRKDTIAFGPFLCLGLILAMVCIA